MKPSVLLIVACTLVAGSEPIPAREPAAQERSGLERAQDAYAQASAAYQRGDAEAALELLDGVLSDPELPPAWANFLRVYSAEVARFAQRFEMALARIDEIEGVLGDSPDDRKLGCYIRALRAWVYLDWGLLNLAADASREARARLAALPASAKSERLYTASVSASVALALQNYGELHVIVTGALEGEPDLYEEFPAERTKLLSMLGTGWKELARFDLSQAEPARGYLLAALEGEHLGAPDRIQPALGLAELAARERDWEAFERWLAVAEEHLATFDQPETTRMYATARILRSRAAIERCADDGALLAEQDALRAVLAGDVQRWSERQDRRGGYGLLQFNDQSGLLGELIELVLLLGAPDSGEVQALEVLLAFQDEGSLARRIGKATTDVASLRARLLQGPDHGLLIYSPAPERTHLFLVDQRQVRHVELAPMDWIELARADFELSLHKLTGASPRTAAAFRARFDAASERLQRALLPPEALAVVERWQRWTVAGENRIGELPFEAFTGSDGRPIGITRAIDHLPSPSVGVALAARAERFASLHANVGGNGVALFAKTTLASGSGAPLVLEPSALTSLLAAYRDVPTSAALDADARLAALRAACHGARVVQLFTHGSYDLTVERPAFFQLADGAVGCDEVETLDSPELVVLSVCGSAMAPLRRGDPGAASLIGAFLQGGRARCVVASSFDLEVEATRRMSRSFHAALAHGASPAEAMRAAREALVRDARFAGPEYHALMQVIGLGQTPTFER